MTTLLGLVVALLAGGASGRPEPAQAQPKPVVWNLPHVAAPTYYHVLNLNAFAAKVKDISEFLAGTRLAQRLKTPLNKRVGYDDPCHLIHGQRIKNEPRTLLRAIPGIEFVEVEGADQCCGSAGIYNIVQNELSMAILDAKMEQIKRAKLDILATGNPGCMFQFRYGAKRAGLTLEVVHPVELLARSVN